MENYFIDYITRRLDVSELVSNFNKQAISNSDINLEIKSILTELNVIDFVTVLTKFYLFKPYLGVLLNKVNLPLPILFSIPAVSQNIECYQP
jgi:hypothetical protein